VGFGIRDVGRGTWDVGFGIRDGNTGRNFFLYKTLSHSPATAIFLATGDENPVVVTNYGALGHRTNNRLARFS